MWRDPKAGQRHTSCRYYHVASTIQFGTQCWIQDVDKISQDYSSRGPLPKNGNCILMYILPRFLDSDFTSLNLSWAIQKSKKYHQAAPAQPLPQCPSQGPKCHGCEGRSWQVTDIFWTWNWTLEIFGSFEAKISMILPCLSGVLRMLTLDRCQHPGLTPASLSRLLRLLAGKLT